MTFRRAKPNAVLWWHLSMGWHALSLRRACVQSAAVSTPFEDSGRATQRLTSYFFGTGGASGTGAAGNSGWTSMARMTRARAGIVVTPIDGTGGGEVIVVAPGGSGTLRPSST